MPEVRIRVDGTDVRVPEGTSVAVAAREVAGKTRTSVCGERRAPLCGMGICFECRVTIDGVAHERSCLILCCEGMEVHTDG